MGRLSLILGLICIAGCGPSKVPHDLPKCYPCQITVIQDGAPLDGASVTLQSPEVGQIWFPMGTTDQMGKADMYTNGRYPGAPAGVYKVLVNKGAPPPDTLGAPPTEGTPAYDRWLERMSSQPEYTAIELQYSDAAKTPYEIEVKTKGKNEMTVDVGKAVRIRMP
jgi:hypothetical protein